ncbi:TM2 domain-containing protein [Rheinheimera salexigens]|nr:TM2 domain-containing protein [Rheinheimera salexigens]
MLNQMLTHRLKQSAVDAEEEQIRKQVTDLSDAARQQFYLVFKQQVKDPDTYAVLNWCFFAGAHHFYLGAWLRGLINLLVAVIGIAMLFSPFWLAGVVLLVLLSAAEFWALFRSQIIVQHYNNQLMQKILNQQSILS